MDHLFNFRSLKQRRRRLRQQPILSEIWMWAILRNRKFYGLKFRRQYSIGMYIVDFYCPQLRIVIEVDGESHSWPGRRAHDIYRQGWLEDRGMRVVRFSSTDVVHNTEGVADSLKQFIQKLHPYWPGEGKTK